MDNDDYIDLVKGVFGTQAGTKLLDMWAKMYGDRISFNTGDSFPDVSYREGERAFYQSIEDIVNG